MAKIYRANIYLTDYNGQIQDLDHLKDELLYLEDKLGFGIEIKDLKESEEFEWDDELLINKVDADIEDFEAYFKD
jgi:catechol-2,3-dioxygenase